jgi:hypothetical protein
VMKQPTHQAVNSRMTPLPCRTARAVVIPARHPRTPHATRLAHQRGHSRAAVARAETRASRTRASQAAAKEEEARPQGVRATLAKFQSEVRRVRFGTLPSSHRQPMPSKKSWRHQGLLVVTRGVGVVCIGCVVCVVRGNEVCGGLSSFTQLCANGQWGPTRSPLGLELVQGHKATCACGVVFVLSRVYIPMTDAVDVRHQVKEALHSRERRTWKEEWTFWQLGTVLLMRDCRRDLPLLLEACTDVSTAMDAHSSARAKRMSTDLKSLIPFFFIAMNTVPFTPVIMPVLLRWVGWTLVLSVHPASCLSQHDAHAH